MVAIRPPLWSSDQSSLLQIQRSGFDSRPYQIFWEVVGLERGPISLVSTIEELLEIKSSGSGLESREYGRRIPSRWTRVTIYARQLALTSPTSGGHSVGIVRSRTQATEFLSVQVVVILKPNVARSVSLWPDFDLWLFSRKCVSYRIEGPKYLRDCTDLLYR
jgi:hypothetical protein